MTIRTDAGGPIVRSAQLPGGLSNLGNTCYMASALQMIASLESFVDRLQETEPEAPASDNLRAHLLDTLRCLARGDTVRPMQLKEAIDERSSLFTGYRQQDAHEFLTTLLDLLDEDYKREDTSPEEEEQQQQAEGMDTAEAGGKAEETASAEPEASTEDAMEVEQTAVVEPYSPSKKARTEEPSSSSDDSSNEEMEESSESSALEGLLKLSAPLNEFHQSFSELDVDAIGRLLHGNSDDTLLPPEVSTVSTSPVTVSPYKLVGGRMNTADVVLTPYGNEDDDYNSNSNESSQQAHPSLATTPNTASPNTSMVTDDDEDDEPDKVLSPIDETFTTQVRVRLTCDSCKYTRCHKETFWHLSLEIGENTATTIEDGLRKFFGPCRNEVKCEKCFGETATQTTEITSLPPALLLHFKRFIVDVSPDYTEISYRKNRSTVLYDPMLAVAEEEGGILSEFLAPDCVLPKSSSGSTRKNNSKKSGHDNAGTSSSPKYSLRSVVNHIGSSASCGHYTADAAIQQQQEPPQWTRFNDSFVSRISATEAIEQSRQTAYMVLYELD